MPSVKTTTSPGPANTGSARRVFVASLRSWWVRGSRFALLQATKVKVKVKGSFKKEEVEVEKQVEKQAALSL